jgi:hypothetical protein
MRETDMSEQNVQEVFGQFAVEIAGEVALFTTHAEAAQALSAHENAAEFTTRATAFTASKGLDGKTAKAKINVIEAFLAWEAAGSPELVVEPESTDAVDTAGEGWQQAA